MILLSIITNTNIGDVGTLFNPPAPPPSRFVPTAREVALALSFWVNNPGDPCARLSGAALRWRGHQGHPVAREVSQVPFKSRRPARLSPTPADHARARRAERSEERLRPVAPGRAGANRSRRDPRRRDPSAEVSSARREDARLVEGERRFGRERRAAAGRETVRARCPWRLSSRRSKIRRRARMRCWT